MPYTRQLYLFNLEITLATREIAKFIIQMVLKNNFEVISFKNVKTASRSFLDELYILSVKNNIELIDIPAEIKPLLEIIKKSHKEQKLYAPKVKVRLSDTVFA